MPRSTTTTLNRTARQSALAVGLVLALALAGCSSLPFIPLPTTPAPTEPAALPTELVAYQPVSGEVAVDSLSTQTGTQSLGPFPADSERIAVYVDCIGRGEVIIEIVGVGKFNNPCNRRGGGMGTRNEFDMRFVKDYSLRVSASDEQMWALTVTRPEK